WATTGSLTTARQLHSAVLLGTSSNTTTSGKVLVAGGKNGTSSLSTAQLYSPTGGTWASAPSMTGTNPARHQATATLLANGKVLLAGGVSGSAVVSSAVVYDPASGSGSWTPVGSMGTLRSGHTATLLSTANATLNNKVLIAGGNNGTTSVSTVEYFDGNM